MASTSIPFRLRFGGFPCQEAPSDAAYATGGLRCSSAQLPEADMVSPVRRGDAGENRSVEIEQGLGFRRRRRMRVVPIRLGFGTSMHAITQWRPVCASSSFSASRDTTCPSAPRPWHPTLLMVGAMAHRLRQQIPQHPARRHLARDGSQVAISRCYQDAARGPSAAHGDQRCLSRCRCQQRCCPVGPARSACRRLKESNARRDRDGNRAYTGQEPADVWRSFNRAGTLMRNQNRDVPGRLVGLAIRNLICTTRLYQWAAAKVQDNGRLLQIRSDRNGW